MSPKLSVCFITYNHEKFVHQALDSVLMQQCNFDFEIVIGDDCSTDSTSKIVEEYAAKYPDKIRLNVFEKNVGMTPNWVSTIGACKGEYIALLEGDDFWIDPLKLQKQVDFLDSNVELSFAAHDVGVIFEAGTPHHDSLLHFSDNNTFTLEDYLAKGNFVQTGSVVFRRNTLPAFPKWTDKRVKSIDLLLYLILSAEAPFFYSAEKMGVYRMHTGGVSHVWRTKHNAMHFDTLWLLRKFNQLSKGKFKNSIFDNMETSYLQLLKGNLPKTAVYRKAIVGIMFIRPAKHMGLLKGYIINNFIPIPIYKLYQKIF